MHKKKNFIPVNPFTNDFGATGIFIGKLSVKDIHALTFRGVEQSHRDDYHLFFLQEEGTASIEIDFKIHQVKPSSVIYIHPNQVHRVIAVENVTFSGLGINNEHLSPENLQLLDDMTPVSPLRLTKEAFSMLSEAIAFCIKISDRKHEKLYRSLIKDSSNTLVTLVASQYLERSESLDKLPRFELVYKAFKTLLERNFTTVKRPAEYAEQLHISVPYLNECVKNTTGYSVSHHIQQRVVLEAKRLLYHSDQSVKEIATELGFDDYPYFSRWFTKVTGMTALTFRNKNHD